MPALKPEDCERLFAEALNRGDLEGVVELYEPDAKIRRQRGGVACGTGEIREHVMELLSVKPTVSLESSVLVSSDGDIALTSARWSMSCALPDGQELKETGKSVEIVRRQADGTWRFVIDSSA